MFTTQQTIIGQQASQPIKVEIENPITTQPSGFNWLTLISTLLLATTAAINLFTARSSYQNRQNSLKLQEEERKFQEEERKHSLKLQEEERKLQRLTLMSELQKQYYFLLFDLKNKVKNKQLDAESYYRRYWIEREYEFILFKNEFIDANTYTQWMLSEKSDYELNEKLNDKTFQEGYKETKDFFESRTTTNSTSKGFFKFIEQVFQKNPDSVTKAIDDLSEN